MTLDDADDPGRWPEDQAPPARCKPPIAATPFSWRDPASLPTRQWVYGHDLIRRFLTVTVAPGGVGKTALTIAEALALASGRNLLGVQPPAPTAVWLLNLEDPREEMERRILGACLHYGLDDEQLAGRLYVDSGRDTPCIVAHQGPEGLTVAEPVVSALVDTIRARGISVVIVDPFVSSHAVNENDNGAIDRVAKTWGRVAEMTGSAVHLVHHVRKTGSNEVTVEDSRGAVALLAAARVARVLNVMTKEEGERANVESPRTHFRLTNGKANLAPPPDGASWFRLASVPLFNGPRGSEGDAVGVVEPWAWPNPLDSVTVADLRAAQTAVAAGRWRENVQARDWVGKPIASALGFNLERPADKAKVRSLIRIWLKSGALVIVEGLDDRRERRSFVEVGEWAGD